LLNDDGGYNFISLEQTISIINEILKRYIKYIGKIANNKKYT